MKNFVPIQGHSVFFKELILVDPSADVLPSPSELLANQTPAVHKSRNLLPLTFDTTVEFI